MAGKVIFNSLGYGFVGQISRSVDDITEAMPNKDTRPIPFGSPVVLTTDGVRNVTASDTEEQIIGFAARYAKTNDTYGQDDAKCNPGDMTVVLKRGTMTVQTDGTAISKGAAVYLDSAFLPTGSSTAPLKLSNAVFASAADADGIAEITLVNRRL